MAKWIIQDMFPEVKSIPKIKKVKIAKTKKQFIQKTKRTKKPFSELDKEFWDAQDEWEKSNFDKKSNAWKTMWIRVQHAVYNIVFRRLFKFKEQEEIESLSFEISSNIMQNFLKKVESGKEWKVKAPIAGYCSPFCMVIYADKYKREDEELSLNQSDSTLHLRRHNALYEEMNKNEHEENII